MKLVVDNAVVREPGFCGINFGLLSLKTPPSFLSIFPDLSFT